MKTIKTVIKGCLLLGSLSILISSAFAHEEKVQLKKLISDDKVIVKRKNHEVYELEIGLGCSTISKYEGRKITIYSSGSGPAFNEFINLSSKILLKRSAQKCTIWSGKKLEVFRPKAYFTLLSP